MSEVNQPCQVSNRLDLRIQDLGYLETLLAEQSANNANRFYYTTQLGEELRFIRLRKGHWVNKEYNIAIIIPSE